MISVVVVSHSRPLARAAVELATQMVQGRAPFITIAAGLDEDTLGTDASAVAEALVAADAAADGAGVLVLLDLGSAVLSAELALELAGTEDGLAGRVRLSPAPLVEGLVAAVVSAAGGAGLETCAREAEAGLLPKEGHLGLPHLHQGGGRAGIGGPGSGMDGEDTDDAEQGADWQVVEVSVLGEHGLHARPAARLVACAAEVAPDTQVRVRDVTSGRGPVNALSLSAVATLDARRAHVLRIEARGERAAEVLRDMASLAAVGFGDLPASAESLAAVEATPAAVSAEPGVAGSGLEAALGPSVRVRTDLDCLVDDPARLVTMARAEHGEGGACHGQEGGTPDPDRQEREVGRWRRAVHEARERLLELSTRAHRHLGVGEAEVFDAHATLLRDPVLAAQVRRRIADGSDAVLAWRDTIRQVAQSFEELPDAYHRERATDVRSVGDRLLRVLLGLEEPEVLEHGVLVVDDLDPALAIALDAAVVEGVVTLRGAGTAHGVLIAQSRGIPVITGVGERGDAPDGTLIGFDARSHRLEVDPPARVVRELEGLIDQRRRARDAALAEASAPALTRDGIRIPVKANVSSVAIARWGAGNGAEGSGLVRTEAVFAQWRAAPTVDQQVEVYEAIAQAYAPHPVTIRTWDVGGDKPLPFIRSGVEANPFLGVRGLRAFIEDPRVLLDQVEAICRVATRYPVGVLFPMVTTRSDATWALEQVDEAAARSGLAGRPPGMQIGLMIEVPAAALRVTHLARGFDFVSIGSNDLAQYALAAERGNPHLSRWSDPLEPAVLWLIRHVADQVPDGVRVALCGGLAADADAAGLLVGLGVQELSASAASVPMVKAALREASKRRFTELAEAALTSADATKVRELLRSYLA